MKDRDIKFMQEFNRVKSSIEKGTTPVWSEIRNCKTELKELAPRLLIQCILLLLSTLLINKLNIAEIYKIVVVLVINTTTGTLSSSIFTILKHWYRTKKLKRLGIEPTEANIAVLESLEYQSV